MDAACTLVEAEGVEGFSLRAVARSVGVSANATYRHFPDRSALLHAVATAGFAQLAEGMRKAQAKQRKGASASVEVGRFKATGHAYVEFAVAHPMLFRMMFGPDGSGTVETAEAPPLELGAYATLGEALDGLVHSGLLAPPSRQGAELKAWTVVHGFASLVVSRPGRFGGVRQRRARVDALLDFAVVGLGIPAASP